MGKRTRRMGGFDERETWGLDSTIAKFALPRLRKFKELTAYWSYPGNLTKEKWAKILDYMICAMENCSKDEILNDQVDWKKVNKGLTSFGKYFRSLWW